MGLFHKERPRTKYYKRFFCSNCDPRSSNTHCYSGWEVPIPLGISVEEFLKDESRKCPNCGMKGTLEPLDKSGEKTNEKTS